MEVPSRRQALLVGAAFVAGCATMPGKENVQGFADNLRTAVEEFDRAVETMAEVERAVALENGASMLNAERRARKLVLNAFPPDATPNADAARNALGDLLKVLASYSISLTALVGGADLEAAKASTKAAADRAAEVLPKLGADQASVTQTVGFVTTLAGIVMDMVTASAVNNAVRRADPNIRGIVAFISDYILGRSPKGPGDEGSGLAGAMAKNATAASSLRLRALDEQAQDTRVSAADMDTKYRAAIADHRVWQAMNRVPDAVRDALKKMATAHAALVSPETAGPSLTEFRLAVERVITLYKAAQRPPQ